jgi:UDP-N-acetylmuramyl pentapeptide phosphotransferase/UDP-N-acetylglucosamine-1-phosphate transferase
VTVLLSLMVASFLLAAGFCRVAPAVGLLDRPNDRSLHSSVTPVGVGVVPVSLLALGLVLYEAADFNHYAWPVAGLLIVLSGVGLWDDRWDSQADCVLCSIFWPERRCPGTRRGWKG